MKNNRHIVILAALVASLAASHAVARETTSLNDSWGYKQGALIAWGYYPNISVAKCDTTLNLPHTWNEADFMSDNGYRRGEGSYEKTVFVPESDRGRRLFVRFEGVSQTAVVFCNYQKVGSHSNGYTGFTVEITDKVVYGKDNKMTVVCDNSHRLDVPPVSGDFNVYGGIYRDVWLEKTDTKTCISPLYYGSNGVILRQKVMDGYAQLQAEIHLSTTADYNNCTVEVTVEDAAGKAVASQTSKNILNDKCVMTLAVANPHLWQGTADPYLYKVVTVLRRDGKEIDRVEDKTGFRNYYIDADKGFFLNGKHLKLHGVSRHQEWAGVATALTKANHDRDFELMADMGVNALRLAHYPQAPYMLAEADRRGFVVWEEIPFVNNYIPSEAFDDNLRQTLLEMIYQNINHPSVCFWGLFNEVGGGQDSIVATLNDVAHRADPTRLTTAATCFNRDFDFITDVLGWNKYFGWYEGKYTDLGAFLDNWHKAHPENRLAVSEYGAGAGTTQHVAKATIVESGRVTPTSRFHPMENQTAVHHYDLQAIQERDYIWGSFVWNMFDFGASSRREGETNNLNDKGLVSHDRKVVKDAYYLYRANWNRQSPTTFLCSKGYTARRERLTDVVGFVSGNSATLYVNGKKIGTQKADNVHTVIWKDVRLNAGRNTVLLKSAHGQDSAVWTVEE